MGDAESGAVSAELRRMGATGPDDAATIAEFQAAGALLTGHFALSSGRRSGVYLQCARVMMDPSRGERLCRALASKLRAPGGALHGLPEQPTFVVSPAMGAVIVGYETARSLGLPSVFFERPTGVFELRRGFALPPDAVCVMVEDVVTTGGSSRECIAAAEAAGGRVVAAACLVDRSGGRADVGRPLTALLTIDAPSYPADGLPPELAAIPVTKPGSRATAAARDGGPETT